jgi:hypothetical protein
MCKVPNAQVESIVGRVQNRVYLLLLVRARSLVKSTLFVDNMLLSTTERNWNALNS